MVQSDNRVTLKWHAVCSCREVQPLLRLCSSNRRTCLRNSRAVNCSYRSPAFAGRPDLGFHANDGVRRPGSDGNLRMPPMTFEPMINMADAVRQPRAKLAHAAAWLGVVSANIPYVHVDPKSDRHCGLRFATRLGPFLLGSVPQRTVVDAVRVGLPSAGVSCCNRALFGSSQVCWVLAFPLALGAAAAVALCFRASSELRKSTGTVILYFFSPCRFSGFCCV